MMIGPIAAAQIDKLAQSVSVAVHIIFVCAAAQHPVDNGCHLGAGDGIAGAEGAVGVAGNPAVLGGTGHSAVEPVSLADIGEGSFAYVRG